MYNTHARVNDIVQASAQSRAHGTYFYAGTRHNDIDGVSCALDKRPFTHRSTTHRRRGCSTNGIGARHENKEPHSGVSHPRAAFHPRPTVDARPRAISDPSS